MAISNSYLHAEEISVFITSFYIIYFRTKFFFVIFFILQNQQLRCANSSVNLEVVVMAPSAHIDMFVATVQLSASTGYEGCARKGINVNSFTNMTCPKCLNVTSMLDSTHATIRSVPFFIQTLRAKLRTALGVYILFFVCFISKSQTSSSLDGR